MWQQLNPVGIKVAGPDLKSFKNRCSRENLMKPVWSTGIVYLERGAGCRLCHTSDIESKAKSLPLWHWTFKIVKSWSSSAVVVAMNSPIPLKGLSVNPITCVMPQEYRDSPEQLALFADCDAEWFTNRIWEYCGLLVEKGPGAKAKKWKNAREWLGPLWTLKAWYWSMLGKRAWIRGVDSEVTLLALG